MIIKPILLVIFGIMLLIMGIFSFMGCKRGKSCNISPEKKAQWITKKVSKELDLSDDQQTILKGLVDEVIVKTSAFKESRKDVKDAFLAEVKKDAIDESILNSLMDGKESEFKEIRAFVIAKLAEFHGVLTPDQRIKLSEKLEKMNRRHHKK